MSILLYADDIVLIAPSADHLQKMLNILERWCRKWGMSINAKKTQILHVRNHQRPRSQFKFTFSDTELQYTDCYKYLGFLVHEHLNNDHHASTLAAAASRSFSRIHNIFKKVGNMGINSYQTLCDSYVYPIMNYGSGVWGYEYQDKPQLL